MPLLSLSKKTFGLFRQFFAVCCAHNLFAIGEQIPHLQPEKYFAPGTGGELPRRGKRDHPGVRRGRKRFWTLFFAYAKNSAKLF